MARGPDDARETVLLAVACVVVTVWAVATLVQVALPDHQVPTSVNVVMPIVATALFGGAAWTGRQRRRNGKDDG